MNKNAKVQSEKEVDLLLVERDGEAHYILIENRSRLEGKHHQKSHIYCTGCQKRFLGAGALANHRKQCYNLHEGIMEFPKEDFYFFNNQAMTMKFPFCLYYDWECFIKPKSIEDAADGTSFTRQTAELIPSGYSFTIVTPEDGFYAGAYDGEDCVEHFMQFILKVSAITLKYIKRNAKKMNPTAEELERHRQATVCFICHREFEEKNRKVLHHDHITSKVIGTLCNRCNLQVKFKNQLPMVCHNSVNFDHNIVIQSFDMEDVTSVRAIPKTTEKFLGLIVNNRCKFMDSCQFLKASLSSLVKNLRKMGIDKFKYTKKYFGCDEKVLEELILCKQVYPYDYMTGPEVYNETKLPAQEKFYDGLNQKPLSDKDYAHAQKVWDYFGFKTFRDFTRFYSITDALLLADVFENFRDTAFEAQNLDPLYKWSAPGYSWECAMYSSKVSLEYVKDFEILNMLEGAIRGGPTFVTERICTANSENLGADVAFDETKPRKHVMYNDLNALYSCCMTKKLPYKDFKMLTPEEVEAIDIMSLDADADTSYIFEVDLDYPQHLHDSHDDLPLAVEKRAVLPSDLSPTQAKLVGLYEKVRTKPLGGEKLIMTLYPKKNYVTYLKTLQFYVRHGLLITKVHRGFSFTQGYVLKDYIESNIAKRRETSSALMSDLYKLLNNSLYGKTLQNSKNFMDVLFCLDRERTVDVLAKSNLKTFFPLSENITVCFLNRERILCNSFTYLGFVILELAKLVLYEAYYDGIKKVFGPRVRVLYGDTDSLIVSILDPNKTLIEDLAKLSDWYDLSNLS